MKWFIIIATIMMVYDAEAKYLFDITILNSPKLKAVEVNTLALQAGFSIKEAKTMTCIAEKESNFRTKIISKKNTNHTKDYGLMQINTVWLEKCQSNLYSILHPETNMKCAKLIHSKQGFRAWAAYKKHKHYCKGYVI